METKKGSCPAIRIIGDVLIAAAVLLTVDVVIVMTGKINSVVLKNEYISMFKNEIWFCAVLILFALDVRFGFFTKIRSTAGKVIGWILRIIVTALAAVILFLCGKVIAGGFINTAEAEKDVIILGLALENGKPVRDLYYRVETGQKYWEQHDDVTLILTGGNPDKSGKTEADVMHDILAERGVPEERMYLENKSENTVENFENTAKMIDPATPIVLVSSNYHMSRAVRLAKQAGLTNIKRLPAPSEFLKYGSNMMWEVGSELNQWKKSILSGMQ